MIWKSWIWEWVESVTWPLYFMHLISGRIQAFTMVWEFWPHYKRLQRSRLFLFFSAPFLSSFLLWISRSLHLKQWFLLSLAIYFPATSDSFYPFLFSTISFHNVYLLPYSTLCHFLELRQTSPFSFGLLLNPIHYFLCLFCLIFSHSPHPSILFILSVHSVITNLLHM